MSVLLIPDETSVPPSLTCVSSRHWTLEDWPFCDAVSSASDLIAVSLLATELGAGVTGPLWDAYRDCVRRAGTSPEVEGEKGLPLWWCTHLCQHKCQVSPSCKASWAKCPCIHKYFVNAFKRRSSSMKLCVSLCESLLNCTVWRNIY